MSLTAKCIGDLECILMVLYLIRDKSWVLNLNSFYMQVKLFSMDTQLVLCYAHWSTTQDRQFARIFVCLFYVIHVFIKEDLLLVMRHA